MNIKKVVITVMLLLMTMTAGFVSTPTVAYAAEGAPAAPLASGLTWTDQGQMERSVQLNMKGDTLVLPGQAYQAVEKFSDGLSPDVAGFYSNVELFNSGWESNDSWEDAAGTHLVFYHEAGYYLAIDYLKCADDASSTCVNVWLSAHKDGGTFIVGQSEFVQNPGTDTIFGKKTPADNSTGINPSSTYLSWTTYSSTFEAYSYCVHENVECISSDPNWTRTYKYNSITLTNLDPNKIYMWQVKAITDVNTVPKKFVLADGGDAWKFSTSTTNAKITGNAGASGVTLSWMDGYAKSTTSDTSGNYSISVSYNWSGTIVPSKTGYTFSPTSRSYLGVTSNKTFQNFLAINGFTISGNAGVAGAVLSYSISGDTKSVTSNSSGGYVATVPSGWSGNITPRKTGYTFSPVRRAFTNVLSSKIGQNYTATLIHYTISGNAGVAGAKLTYVDGTTKSVLADGSGDYSISVPYNWTGKVTPSKTGVSAFVPAYKSYTKVLANATAQNYRATYLFSVRSIGADDGFVRESTQNSSVGGTKNSTNATFFIGDSPLNQEYRGILSFDTSGIPDTAVIQSAKLILTKQAVVGSANPMSSRGPLQMNLVSPYYGASVALDLEDFNYAGESYAGNVGATPVGNVYTGLFSTSALTTIDPLSTLQMRLSFQTDDDGNNIANYISFYSGDSATVTYQPKLEIMYYIP